MDSELKATVRDLAHIALEYKTFGRDSLPVKGSINYIVELLQGAVTFDEVCNLLEIP